MNNLSVPLRPYYVAFTTIELPNIDIHYLINLIEDFLSSTKKIKWVKKEDEIGGYEIEYYPIEDHFINPNCRFHTIKYFWAIYASQKALEWFPHNIPMYEGYDGYTDYPPSLSGWFKMRLQIYYDFQRDCYLLEANRSCGETSTFYKVYNKIKDIMNKKNCLWMMRKNYISLVEDMQPKTDDHITRYLLDDLICKEICSYY